ncbi:MAG: ABC transporter ATP-binding protein [Bacteroidales bacterium]|nr:ABC transporter ATP-binding protein [Bacteroidales bacterium]
MVQIKNLSYSYNACINVLENITLTLPEGHIYGLLGRNGVGKSTLLKLLSGALLGKGSYTIDGYDPRKRTAEMQQKIRLVPENEAIFQCTITQLAKVTSSLYPTFSQNIFNKAIHEFQVPTDLMLTRMSLGQQKKALISLSLACGTPYLFMDEPTNGMDIPSKSIFRKLVASMADEKKTLIISTHQVDDLESLIDHVIILAPNGVLLNASLEEIYEKYGTEDLKEVFMQVTGTASNI